LLQVLHPLVACVDQADLFPDRREFIEPGRGGDGVHEDDVRGGGEPHRDLAGMECCVGLQALPLLRRPTRRQKFCSLLDADSQTSSWVIVLRVLAQQRADLLVLDAKPTREHLERSHRPVRDEGRPDVRQCRPY